MSEISPYEERREAWLKKHAEFTGEAPKSLSTRILERIKGVFIKPTYTAQEVTEHIQEGLALGLLDFKQGETSTEAED